MQLLETRIANLEKQLSTGSSEQVTNNVQSPPSINNVDEVHEFGKVNDGDRVYEGDKVECGQEIGLHKGVGPNAARIKYEEPMPRHRVIISKWDLDKGDFEDIDATKREPKKEICPPNQSHIAFTLRKITINRMSYSDRQRKTEAISSELIIESPQLQKLLGRITHKWGWPKSVMNCRSPYVTLIHSWSKAQDEARMIIESESNEEKKARADLSLLLHLISTTSACLPLDLYFKDRSLFVNDQPITHTCLWTLFPPGSLIISQPFLDQPQLFSVQACDNFAPENGTFHLTCYSFDWNGYEFNRVPYRTEIPYWGTERRSIVELPFYPFNHYVGPDAKIRSGDAQAALKCQLIKRGQKFEGLCKDSVNGQQMYKHSGKAHVHSGRGLLHTSNTADRERGRSDESLHGGTTTNGDPFNLETGSITEKESPGAISWTSGPFSNTSRQVRRSLGLFAGTKEIYRYEWDRHPPNRPLTYDQLLMCPPRALGYALKQKKWAQFSVDKLQPPDKADASTFEDKLQLNHEMKRLVKQSVQTHKLGKEMSKWGKQLALQDFAPDKGKGLVIMLYGHPGVGKTLTAESMALMVGRPQLSIGVSDIGTQGDKVEANLEKVFDLANKWEAVLLFDEADVFLESLGKGEVNLQRNTMVSVLLRVLEYYDAILILTTNRMRSFEIAVQSRIHIAIKYAELHQDHQFNIYKAFLQQLNNKGLVEDYADLEKWAKITSEKTATQFNGRQIRNIISTALGLAMVDDDGRNKLRKQHLIDVTEPEQTKDFKMDLKSQEDIYRENTT